MVDPDAPSRQDPRAAQWLHWLVVNIPGRYQTFTRVTTRYSIVNTCHVSHVLYPGDELMIGQGVREGKVLMQHNGPSPPGGSGPHRYVLVVYEQPRAVNARVSRNRAGFKLESFARRNRLGDPVAGNFYYAEKK